MGAHRLRTVHYLMRVIGDSVGCLPDLSGPVFFCRIVGSHPEGPISQQHGQRDGKLTSNGEARSEQLHILVIQDAPVYARAWILELL